MYVHISIFPSEFWPPAPPAAHSLAGEHRYGLCSWGPGSNFLPHCLLVIQSGRHKWSVRYSVVHCAITTLSLYCFTTIFDQMDIYRIRGVWPCFRRVGRNYSGAKANMHAWISRMHIFSNSVARVYWCNAMCYADLHIVINWIEYNGKEINL